jgi:hypothetical protein
MSEAEIVESMTEYFGLNAEMLSIYLTVTSGYLIVAYLVGSKLTRSQLIIVSGLYLVFATATSYLAIGYGMRGIHYGEILRNLSPSTPLYSTKLVPGALAFVLLGGIVANFRQAGPGGVMSAFDAFATFDSCQKQGNPAPR